MPTATATPADHQIQVQPRPGVNSASPTTPSFVQLMEAALVGGDPVYEFFAGHFNALQGLYQTIATGGDEVWLDGTDEKSGDPVKYVAQGDNFLTVSHTFTDTGPLKDGTGSTDTYKPVGIAYVTFTTDQGTSQMVLNDVHYAGLGLGGLLAAPVLAKFGLSIIKSVASWIKNTAIKIYNRVSGGGSEDADQAEDDVESDASEAAEESAEEGAEVAEGVFADVSITVAQGVFFAVGIGIMAIVFILQLLSKEINAQVRFYNVTKLDITFGVCKVDGHTGMSNGPAKVGSTAVVTHVSKAKTPPWIIGSDTAIYYAEAAFLNTNELFGVGYLLSAEPTGDFPGFKVGVEIPSDDPNVMLVELTNESCNDAWDKLQDEDPERRITPALTASATSGPYTLKVATNAFQGRTASPLSGAVGYNYEHLVVLTDGSVSA